MSRIFTLEEMSGSQIPHIDSFAPALQLLVEGIRYQKWFIGCMPYGSFAMGSYSVVSDLDCLVICDAAYFHEAAVFIGTLVQQIKTKTFVQIGVTQVTYSQLRAVPEKIAPSGMWFHMLRLEQSSPKNISGMPVSEALNLSRLKRVDLKEELADYAYRSYKSVSRGVSAVQESAEWYEFARKLLDRPFHLSRMFVDWRLGHVSGTVDNSINLRENLMIISQEMGQLTKPLPDLLQSFWQAKVTYRTEVSSVAYGAEWRIDSYAAYLDQVQEINNLAPIFLRFLQCLSDVAESPLY